ncbi:MAG: FAD-binding oxidoreductase [Spirochaetes bacterium]|nr:FAD-binding oxidoreductase [Spirochaetota bacterium]
MVHILGGGVAGFMLAEALDKRGTAWHLYEKAAKAGTEASGKNAGIVRTHEVDPVLRHFTKQSLAYYRDNEPSFEQNGMLLKSWEIDYDTEEREERPFLHGRYSGKFYPDNGLVEPLRLMARLAGQPYRHGAMRYRFSAILQKGGNRLVAIDDAHAADRITIGEGDLVVVACGEGSIALSNTLARPLMLTRHERTLFEYENTVNYSGPVQWNEEASCYFRRLGKTLLSTAGEQIPVSEVRAEQGLEFHRERIATIEREFPFLSRDRLVAHRTCLRVMPLDNRPYCGYDSEIKNLVWFTGLGGRGISIAPALSAALADYLTGKSDGSALEPLSPERAD